MTVTVLRSTSARVAIDYPDTAEAEKTLIEADGLDLFIGRDSDGAHRVQLNDYIVSISQLDQILERIAAPLFEHQKMDFPVRLRIDRQIPMSPVYEVKLLLRKHGLRKVTYITTKSDL